MAGLVIRSIGAGSPNSASSTSISGERDFGLGSDGLLTGEASDRRSARSMGRRRGAEDGSGALCCSDEKRKVLPPRDRREVSCASYIPSEPWLTFRKLWAGLTSPISNAVSAQTLPTNSISSPSTPPASSAISSPSSLIFVQLFDIEIRNRFAQEVRLRSRERHCRSQ